MRSVNSSIVTGLRVCAKSETDGRPQGGESPETVQVPAYNVVEELVRQY